MEKSLEHLIRRLNDTVYKHEYDVGDIYEHNYELPGDSEKQLKNDW